jgi:hypothetical protein
VFLSVVNRTLGFVDVGFTLLRKAATQPAATGQAAETPVSGTNVLTVFDPRKWV